MYLIAKPYVISRINETDRFTYSKPTHVIDKPISIIELETDCEIIYKITVTKYTGEGKETKHFLINNLKNKNAPNITSSFIGSRHYYNDKYPRETYMRFLEENLIFRSENNRAQAQEKLYEIIKYGISLDNALIELYSFISDSIVCDYRSTDSIKILYINAMAFNCCFPDFFQVKRYNIFGFERVYNPGMGGFTLDTVLQNYKLPNNGLYAEQIRQIILEEQKLINQPKNYSLKNSGLNAIYFNYKLADCNDINLSGKHIKIMKKCVLFDKPYQKSFIFRHKHQQVLFKNCKDVIPTREKSSLLATALKTEINQSKCPVLEIKKYVELANINSILGSVPTKTKTQVTKHVHALSKVIGAMFSEKIISNIGYKHSSPVIDKYEKISFRLDKNKYLFINMLEDINENQLIVQSIVKYLSAVDSFDINDEIIILSPADNTQIQFELKELSSDGFDAIIKFRQTLIA